MVPRQRQLSQAHHTRLGGSRQFSPWNWNMKVKMLVIQSCPTLYDSMDCSPPGSSVHRILQARILEWVAIPFSRGSSPPRDQTWVSRIAGRFLCCLSQMWNACGSNPRSHGILMLFRLRHHRPVNSSGEQKTCGSWRFGLGSRSLGWGRGGDAVFWERRRVFCIPERTPL